MNNVPSSSVIISAKKTAIPYSLFGDDAHYVEWDTAPDELSMLETRLTQQMGRLEAWSKEMQLAARVELSETLFEHALAIEANLFEDFENFLMAARREMEEERAIAAVEPQYASIMAAAKATLANPLPIPEDPELKMLRKKWHRILASSPHAASPTKNYTLRPGDTLKDVALMFRVPERDVAICNDTAWGDGHVVIRKTIIQEFADLVALREVTAERAAFGDFVAAHELTVLDEKIRQLQQKRELWQKSLESRARDCKLRLLYRQKDMLDAFVTIGNSFVEQHSILLKELRNEANQLYILDRESHALDRELDELRNKCHRLWALRPVV